MSASLVGSEMCIRDSHRAAPEAGEGLEGARGVLDAPEERLAVRHGDALVDAELGEVLSQAVLLEDEAIAL
eukprot:2923336-Alexandrium_andersonii.AAC.1